MNSKPILFTGGNVRAILDNRKSMTRRVIKPQPKGAFVRLSTDLGYPGGQTTTFAGFGNPESPVFYPCPYGKPGDLLWVRETWRVGAWSEDQCLAIDYRADGSARREWLEVPDEEMFERLWIQSTDDAMKAGIETNPDGDYEWEPGHGPCRWRPSIFMPRWASRLTLRISNLRVERVQEITVPDLVAEGLEGGVCDCPTDPPGYGYHALCPASDEYLMDQFRLLWDSINAEPKPAKRNPHTNAPESCLVSYPWDDVRKTETLQSGKKHYIIGNPYVWIPEWDTVWRENVNGVLSRLPGGNDHE